MHAEVITVGTELLIGSVVNTNQVFLSRRLAAIGLDVYRLSAVGDNRERLSESILQALLRSPVVIVTGGLGPTDDDITLRTVSSALGLPLERDGKTYRALLRIIRYKKIKMTASVARQAEVPRGSSVLKNRYGTAPGIFLSCRFGDEMRTLVLLPGPPGEMEPMFDQVLLKKLKKLAGRRATPLKTSRFIFPSVQEHLVAQKTGDLLNQKPPVTIGIYSRPGEVELKIMSKLGSSRARKLEARVVRQILSRFSNQVILKEGQSLETLIGHRLKSNHLSVAIAESCTGGLLGHRVTSVPGSSRFFLGSVVTYHNDMKRKLLGVSSRNLEKFGAVSAEVAKQMAQGVRMLCGSHYGISVTGIAGPAGGSPKKPVGLVFVGISGPLRTRAFRLFFLGRRDAIKQKAATAALTLLWKEIRPTQ